MSVVARLQAAYNALKGDSPRTKKDPVPPGNFSVGNTYLSGPLTTDAFGARRAPSPWQLVEKHKSLIYAMVERNKHAVTRIPLRLYADGSRVQGRPRSVCDPIRVSRRTGERLWRDGNISSSAVDQVYEVRTHPILEVLDKPDPYGYFNRDRLIGLMVASCDVIGSFYLMPEGPGWRGLPGKKGPPDYLWVLYSQYVQPIRKAGDPRIDHFQYFGESIPYDQLVWFKQSISLRDPYGSGYSPVYAGDIYAAQEDRFITMAEQILGIGPRPSLILSAKDANMPMGEDQAKRLEQDTKRKDSAALGGNVLVSRGAIDVNIPSYPNADPAGITLSEYDRNNLACIFGQPPTFYTTDTNLANLQAAKAEHAANGVEPRCKSIAGQLTALVKEWDPRLFFAFDPALAEDEEAHERVVASRLKIGRTTINQENEETRWPPVAWGDEPWMPGTLVQPSMAQEKHEAGIAQGEAAIKQGDAAIESQSARDEFELQDDPESAEGESEAERNLILDRALDRLEAEIARRRAG